MERKGATNNPKRLVEAEGSVPVSPLQSANPLTKIPQVRSRPALRQKVCQVDIHWLPRGRSGTNHATTNMEEK